MSQTAYSLEHNIAYAGMQADSGIDYDVSRTAEGVIGFGLGAVAGTDAEEQVRLPLFETSSVTYGSDFGASNVISFTVNGVSISPVTYASSHAATLTALVAAVNGLTGVTATNPSGRVVKVVVSGVDNVSTTSVAGGSAVTSAVVTSSSDVVRGISVAILNQTTGNYTDTNIVTVKRRGAIWVQTDGSGVTVDGSVYIDTDGKFTDSTTDSLAVSGASYVKYDSTTELALVEINIP